MLQPDEMIEHTELCDCHRAWQNLRESMAGKLIDNPDFIEDLEGEWIRRGHTIWVSSGHRGVGEVTGP